MPQVECIVFDGLEARLYSSDHEPPHFHLKRRGEWELRVYFLENERAMFETVWAKKVPAVSVLRGIAKEVSARRHALLLEWTQKVNKDDRS
jgi:hypothetical protein